MNIKAIQNMFRDGRERNDRTMTAEQDELFSSLCPELRPLQRGWTWKFQESLKNKGGLAMFGFHATLYFSLWLLAFNVMPDPHFGATAAARTFSYGVTSAVFLIFTMVLVRFANSEIRRFIFNKNVMSRPISERKDLAVEVLALSYIFQKSDLIDPAVVQKGKDNGIEADAITEEFDVALASLRETAGEVAEKLISENGDSIRNGFCFLAGNEEDDLTSKLRRVRRAQEGLETRVDHLIAERDLAADIQSRRQDVRDLARQLAGGGAV